MQARRAGIEATQDVDHVAVTVCVKPVEITLVVVSELLDAPVGLGCLGFSLLREFVEGCALRERQGSSRFNHL